MAEVCCLFDCFAFALFSFHIIVLLVRTGHLEAWAECLLLIPILHFSFIWGRLFLYRSLALAETCSLLISILPFSVSAFCFFLPFECGVWYLGVYSFLILRSRYHQHINFFRFRVEEDTEEVCGERKGKLRGKGWIEGIRLLACCLRSGARSCFFLTKLYDMIHKHQHHPKNNRHEREVYLACFYHGLFCS